jgi:phenylalanine-4-hydroxylase
VAGGPADPGDWNHWYGDHAALGEGEAEAQARERKAQALPRDLADLYIEARNLREGKDIPWDRLEALKAKSAKYPDEWLLQAELNELEAMR